MLSRAWSWSAVSGGLSGSLAGSQSGLAVRIAMMSSMREAITSKLRTNLASDQRLGVARELQDPAPGLVVLVLGTVDDSEAVPALIAQRVRVALLESDGLEGARAVLVSREPARTHEELSVPVVRQGDLELGVAKDAMDVTMGHGRRPVLVDVDVLLRASRRGKRGDHGCDAVRNETCCRHRHLPGCSTNGLLGEGLFAISDCGGRLHRPHRASMHVGCLATDSRAWPHCTMSWSTSAIANGEPVGSQ